MVYLNEIFDEIIKASQHREFTGPNGLHLFDLFKIACEEIEKLDVLGFPPNKRFRYTIVRQAYRKLGPMSTFTGSSTPYFIQLTTELKTLFQDYGTVGSLQNSREFLFIRDPDLKTIIERDYQEFNNILIPDKAWKSAVVLAGSILEAVLFDVLCNPVYISSAMASSKSPRSHGVAVDPRTTEWKLITLIEVAVDISVLPASKAGSIDQILRDYRNFVHPKKEVRSSYPCTEAEAFLAKGALDSVLNHIEMLFP